MTPVIVGVVALVVGAAVGFLVRANMAKSSREHPRGAGAPEGDRGRPEGPSRPNQEAATDPAQGQRGRQGRGRPDPSRGRGGREVPPRRDRPPRAAHPRIRGRGSGSAPGSSTPAATELEQRDEMLHEARLRLEKAADQHRIQLERIAGMTSSEAREELVAARGRRREALGHGAGARDRAARARGGRGASPQDPDDRDPARRLRADRRIHGQRLRAAERGHEGPDHRPRGPQHPGLRGRPPASTSSSTTRPRPSC